MAAARGIRDEQVPHLSHFAVFFRCVDSMVGPGIEYRSAILWLRYLVPLPPPFAASDEIHRGCFRRWVRLGSRCLCTPCCGSTRRWVFVVEETDGGGVAFYATAAYSRQARFAAVRSTNLTVAISTVRRKVRVLWQLS
jgi:hypothetical protein